MQIHLHATYSLANGASKPVSVVLIMCMSLCSIFVTAWEHYAALTTTVPYIVLKNSDADHLALCIVIGMLSWSLPPKGNHGR